MQTFNNSLVSLQEVINLVKNLNPLSGDPPQEAINLFQEILDTNNMDLLIITMRATVETTKVCFLENLLNMQEENNDTKYN